MSTNRTVLRSSRQGIIRQSFHRPRYYFHTNTRAVRPELRIRSRPSIFTATRASVIPLVALGGFALSRKSITWCNSLQQAQPHPHAKNTSVVDLILPSLQALLRVLRLLQTTGLIIFDYEWHKFTQKATNLFDGYLEKMPIMAASMSSSSSSSSTNEVEKHDQELSSMTKSQLQQYWEQEVKRRHDVFEKAQMTYASPSSSSNPEDMPNDESKRQQKLAMKEAAAAWVSAEDELEQIGGSHMSQIHKQAAQRLVALCRTNAGVYIKIGQHLANLDYIIPQEYIDGLGCLLDDAPTSTYESVCQVVQEELGASPNDIFDRFEVEPIASASLAQVHVAYDKVSGRKLAVKVQHRGLRETCKGDLLALTTVVQTLELFFEEFNFGWISDEIAPQLPLELDFQNEGRNSERAASYLAKRHSPNHDVVIPAVLWDHTSTRVLCMEFEEGFRCTDVDAIQKAGLNPRDVSQLISRVFHSQTFLDAWVHCDPHPANVLLRKSATSGKPQMVLVDHGLYKELDDDFRITYAKLWKALMMADIPTIRESCRALGVDGQLYTLLSGLLTARPFDEVVERSKAGSFGLKKSKNTKSTNEQQQDKAVIRGYAQKFLVDILTMIDMLPRQMVLLLKMNDCLRHIDYALGSPPSNNLMVAGRVSAQAVYEDRIRNGSHSSRSVSPLQRFSAWVDYVMVLWRIQVYDFGAWWMESRRRSISH